MKVIKYFIYMSHIIFNKAKDLHNNTVNFVGKTENHLPNFTSI